MLKIYLGCYAEMIMNKLRLYVRTWVNILHEIWNIKSNIAWNKSDTEEYIMSNLHDVHE